MTDSTTCLVADCERRTSRSYDEWICAAHWRMVPGSWKRRLSFFRRAYTKALKRGDKEKVDQSARAWWKTWARVKKLFEQPAIDGSLPPAIAEALRKDGLL